MKFSFAPVQSLQRFDEMINQAILAESLGFDALWAHEHHSQGMMYPSPLMTLSILAGKTKQILLGTNMLLLSLHHPVRVAEEGAMVDALSEGRLRLGVSAGYSDVDLKAFNVDPSERGKKMDEGLRIITTLWTKEHIDLDDQYSHLIDYSVFPKPVQKPRPPIYVGATVDAAIRRAARLGDEFLISATQKLDDIQRIIDVYNSELTKLGKNSDKKMTTINRIVHVVESSSQKSLAEQFFGECLLRLYDAWGHQNITDLDNKSRLIEQLSHDHFIIGEPRECSDIIMQYYDLGIREIACLMNFGGPDLEYVKKSMKLFAEKVMPQFK
jgi:alkanesulfonate monooxygenase SsuD/methylene tetrahydromethanopterin reductase-like flavin-dependent oxidoreductase (luciferase family)